MKKTLLALSLVALTSTASAIPLTDLLNGQSITAGDKYFDQWEILFSDNSEGRTINTDNIDINALHDGGLDPGPGLNYSILNDEFQIFGDGFFSYLDFTIGFRVTVLEPHFKIKDNSLELLEWELLNPSFLSSVYIEEKVYDDESLDELLGIKDVGADNFFGPDVYDEADFAPNSSVYVTTNILLEAIDFTEGANLLAFEQRFSQVDIPEPAIASLVLAGIAGLTATRKKKS